MMTAVATNDVEHDVAPKFLDQLKLPIAYPHPVDKIRLLETHISYIFLTGQFAYKIKKAVNLGFLDFTQLEQRHHFCQEELRLNRRLAPSLYLAVVPIGEVPGGIRIGETTKIIEYAVKMLQFPQSSLLDCCLAEKRLSAAQIDAVADQVAAFHAQAARSSMADTYGSPETIWASIENNLQHLSALSAMQDQDSPDMSSLRQLEAWSRHEFRHLKTILAERKSEGHVRECHGDLHLGNIAWWRDAPQIFDGIEFSAKLRWIDVISEIAFTSMDFKAHGRCDYAYRFLNRYLETTGDYAGLKLLPFYETDRAVVRAMVARLRSTQEPSNHRRECAATSNHYLSIAKGATEPRRRKLWLMHGLSGSGKTTVSQAVIERMGAIRLRSDVERKRLRGLASGAHSHESFKQGLYDSAMTRTTYLHLLQLARQVLEAGFPVVIDAANLQAWQREMFRSQAIAQDVPFLILSCRASEETLFARLQARGARGDDASDADPLILRHQLATFEALTATEEQESLLIDPVESPLENILCRLEADF